MTSIDLPERPRILVVTLRRLGDVLLTTPLVRTIRRGFPQGRLDILVFRGSERILKGNPDVDNVITIPERPSAGETLALVRQLWRRYDLAVTTQAGDRPTFYARCGGAAASWTDTASRGNRSMVEASCASYCRCSRAGPPPGHPASDARERARSRSRAGHRLSPGLIGRRGRSAGALRCRACQPVLSLQALERSRLARPGPRARPARACGRRDRRT